MGANASSPQYDPTTDIPDLSGKVALVTGGNTGIGYYTVAHLAQHGAKVYMGARNESRATAAIAQLKADGFLEGETGQVQWLPLDLSTPASTKRGAEELIKREGRLDILIAHKTATLKVDWKTAEGWNFKSEGFIHNNAAYGTTKLANLLFAKELQRLFDEHGINALSIAIHPGEVATDGMRTSMTNFWLGRLILKTVFVVSPLLTPDKGSYNSLFASTSTLIRADKKGYGGAYLVPFGKISQPSAEAKDPVAAKDLWETSEKVVAMM
ncbi:hypothetical protein FRB96_009271 [Tulasnella sp. 330]|nr:hypothetical protein FRB96_009271 [Tulasnella sp. 330]KAG8889445.1 hypothetical protein FRB98_004341 [Tulasnella sp. 332]